MSAPVQAFDIFPGRNPLNLAASLTEDAINDNHFLRLKISTG